MPVPFSTLNSNTLAYPAGMTPGFDQSHVAARNTVLSSAHNGRSHINLLTGIPATVSGTPTTMMDGRMGPMANFNASTTDYIRHQNLPSTTPTNGTACFIFKKTADYAGTAYCYFFSYGTVGNGFKFYVQHGGATDTLKMEVNGGSQYTPGIVIAANVPYFLGVSFTGTGAVVDFYLKNLTNGILTTDFARVFNIAPSAGTTDIYIGTAGHDHQTSNFAISHVMASLAYVPPSAMLKLADNPWSFWYPDQGDNYFGTSSVGSRPHFRWSAR